MVLEKGLVEGRKVYANMTKYIKMTVSSNFKNIFAVICDLVIESLGYDHLAARLKVDKIFENHIEAKSITHFIVLNGSLSLLPLIF